MGGESETRSAEVIAKTLEAKLAGLSVPVADPWGDDEEKREHRSRWPEFFEGSLQDCEEVSKSVGVSSFLVSLNVARGTIRFFWTSKHHELAFALVSDCGRYAQAWKASGLPWVIGGKLYESWILPGSVVSAPIGFYQTHSPGTPVGLMVPVDSFLRIQWAQCRAERLDVGMLALPSTRFPLVEPLLQLLQGRRVRLFCPPFVEFQRGADVWKDQLTAVGCEVDQFDFLRHGVLDARGLCSLPKVRRPSSLFAGIPFTPDSPAESQEGGALE